VASRLAETSPDSVLVAAGWLAGGQWDDTHTWGFEGFGVSRQPADPRPRVPWPLGIGAWLLDEIGWSGARDYLGVNDQAGSVAAAGSIALLVVGDGTARRTEKAPGHLDVRAAAYDVEIARCLAAGDIAGLGSLDPVLGAELMCGGLPAWLWLAGELAGRQVSAADLLVDAAPYGVGYFAATWQLAPSLAVSR
jgi:hypothetical protein